VNGNSGQVVTFPEFILLRTLLSEQAPGALNAHIAVVAYVPPDAEELSVDELMNRIILIEAEYNNKIQSVIKVLSVGDCNRKEVSRPLPFYTNFSFGEEATLNLYCQSWAIRRLK